MPNGRILNDEIDAIMDEFIDSAKDCPDEACMDSLCFMWLQRRCRYLGRNGEVAYSLVSAIEKMFEIS